MGTRTLEAMVAAIESWSWISALWRCGQDSKSMWVEVCRVAVEKGRTVALASTLVPILRDGRRGVLGGG